MTVSQPWLTPPAVAKVLGLDPAKVLKFIKSGELPASNLALRQGGKPRFRIDPSDLEAFLARRQPKPAPPTKRRKRAQTTTEYY